MEIRHQYINRDYITIPGQYDLEFYRTYNYEESKYYKINQYPSEHKPDYFRWKYKDLKYLSPVSYSNMSRYSNVNTLKELGKSYHITNRIRGVKSSNNDKYYEVKNMEENRLDILALKFYNDSSLWWIIAHANNIFDAFTEITRGTILRIPPLNSIYGYYIK